MPIKTAVPETERNRKGRSGGRRFAFADSWFFLSLLLYLFSGCPKIRPMVALVIFSDLDGTLLDHDTYSWRAAEPALARLADIGAPVVLATSKTAAEVVPLQQAMGLEGLPAIVENGAGVIGLGADVGAADAQGDAGGEYARLRHILNALPAQLRAHFSGFGDMTAAEVARATGLSETDAVAAKSRLFSEPGLWSGDAAGRADFIDLLKSNGVHARLGGRFLTLSFGKTKRDGMAEVIAKYAPHYTAALGDAPNDIEMLEAADFGFIIANPHHAPLPPLMGEPKGRIQRTAAPAPAGWTEAITMLLEHKIPPQKGSHLG